MPNDWKVRRPISRFRALPRMHAGTPGEGSHCSAFLGRDDPPPQKSAKKGHEAEMTGWTDPKEKGRVARYVDGRSKKGLADMLPSGRSMMMQGRRDRAAQV
jgi:hypothetical protein